MRVCQLTTVHGAFDDRIFFKQCVSLAAAGHEVIEVAPIERATTVNGVRIEPVRVPRARILRPFIGGWRAYRVVRRLKPDVVHFHDPELIPVALLLRMGGIRFVYDMHELVHGQILDKDWLGPLWIRRCMAWLYTRVERAAVKRAEAIVLAESRYVEEMHARHLRYTHKFELVRNYPVLAVIDAPSKVVERGKEFTVIYVGGLSRPRGINKLIEAVGRVEGARLWLLGGWSSEEFQRECETMEGFARTTWFGLVRMDEVYAYLRAADLGACILDPLPNYVVSEPIKTWEYLACGLPLLLSDFPMWKEVFARWSWYADPMDIGSIVAAIRSAMADPAGRAAKAAAGRTAVERMYSWEHERGRLIDLYRRIGKES